MVTEFEINRSHALRLALSNDSAVGAGASSDLQRRLHQFNRDEASGCAGTLDSGDASRILGCDRTDDRASDDNWDSQLGGRPNAGSESKGLQRGSSLQPVLQRCGGRRRGDSWDALRL